MTAAFFIWMYRTGLNTSTSQNIQTEKGYVSVSTKATDISFLIMVVNYLFLRKQALQYVQNPRSLFWGPGTILFPIKLPKSTHLLEEIADNINIS